jgi:hypothetical protein
MWSLLVGAETIGNSSHDLEEFSPERGLLLLLLGSILG